MKDPKHIMTAIELLQTQKVKKTLPWWFVPLDYAFAVLYLAAFFAVCVFMLKALLSWL